jgi:adenylate cyclase
MAEPGGICLAGGVHEHIGSKLRPAFDDLGPREVKDIAKPVRVFQVQTHHHEEVGRTPDHQPTQTKPSIAVLPFTNLSGNQNSNTSVTTSPRTS